MENVLNTKIHLITPTEMLVVPAEITYDSDGEISAATKLTLVYAEKEYVAFGNDGLNPYILADLAAKLPNGVMPACCMTCRHGNMCPYCSNDNELFCTKDLSITSKEDICNLFDSTDPYKERSVDPLDFCDKFAPQGSDYYTYNDYYSFLSRQQ